MQMQITDKTLPAVDTWQQAGHTITKAGYKLTLTTGQLMLELRILKLHLSSDNSLITVSDSLRVYSSIRV